MQRAYIVFLSRGSGEEVATATTQRRNLLRLHPRNGRSQRTKIHLKETVDRPNPDDEVNSAGWSFFNMRG